PGERPLPLDLELAWHPSDQDALHLHVQAVGVSRYAPSAGGHNLHYPADDARAPTRAVKALKGPPFQEGDARRPPGDGRATQAGVLDALGEFAAKVKADRGALKLAVVHFSGHGDIVAGRHFVFFPHDYDAKKGRGHITWVDLDIKLRDLDCPVLLVMD